MKDSKIKIAIYHKRTSNIKQNKEWETTKRIVKNITLLDRRKMKKSFVKATKNFIR